MILAIFIHAWITKVNNYASRPDILQSSFDMFIFWYSVYGQIIHEWASQKPMKILSLNEIVLIIFPLINRILSRTNLF